MPPPGGGFRSYLAWIITCEFHSWQVYHSGEAVSDHRSRVSKLAGSSPRAGGSGSEGAWVIARVNHAWQARHPKEAVLDHISRGSRLACIIPGKLITPGRRLRIIDRADYDLRVSYLAASSPRGGGFGAYLAWVVARVDHSSRVSYLAGLPSRAGGFRSYLAWIIARAFHSRDAHRPKEAVSDHISRGS